MDPIGRRRANAHNIFHPTGESEGEHFLFALQLASASVLPMALRSAAELDLLELIKTAGPEASASELAALLPTGNIPRAASMIDRILRLLAAYSVLNCSLKTLPDGSVERRYSLAPVCSFFTRNEDGVSLAPWILSYQDRVTMESWYHLKDAVLEGGVPLNRAYGVNAFEHLVINPELNKTFNQLMYEHSTIFMKKILQIYKGFEGLESLVDVGGGIGASLRMILSKYPNIRGINFDLPHVIRAAPPHPGVEHVGGDMFVSVPKTQAIFMKWICHNWNDEECQKLLKNCYEALPENGKIIVADSIIPDDPKSWAAAPWAILEDAVMLTTLHGAKERTEWEFQALAKQAGFKRVIKLCSAINTWIQEFHK